MRRVSRRAIDELTGTIKSHLVIVVVRLPLIHRTLAMGEYCEI